MRAVVALIALAACGTNNTPAEEHLDTEEPEATDTPPTDPASDTDAVPTETGDTGLPAELRRCHPWEPIEIDDWTRTYATTHGTEAGVEVQRMLGDTVTSGFAPSRYVQSELTAGDSSWLGGAYLNCHPTTRWATVQEYDLTWTDIVIFVPQQVTTWYRLPTAMPFLPPPEAMETTETWSWTGPMAYLESLTGGVKHLEAQGTFTMVGLEEVTVPAGTFEAWHVHHDWTRSGVEGGLLATAYDAMDVSADLYFVKGVGLVWEKAWDNTLDVLIYERQLSGYTGLTPE